MFLWGGEEVVGDLRRRPSLPLGEALHGQLAPVASVQNWPTLPGHLPLE